MIYITGDIHGNPYRLNTECFPEQKEMTRDDTVIIAGDFGIVWDYKGENKDEKHKLDWLEDKTFTTVFCEGNHDNHIRLAQYPIKEWNGGLVHEIRPHVLHLMRGEIYTIEGKTFFTFGGASSHDIQDGVLDPEKDKALIKRYSKDWTKLFRVKGVSWWEEELPSEEEMQHGIENLKKYNNKVDFIITHSPSASAIAILGHGAYKQDILTEYLENIKINTEYTRMFSGHMHVNKQMNHKDILIYEQIVRIV